MKNPIPADPAREMVEACVAVRLRLLNRLVTGLFDDALRPHGLRVSQLNILAFLAAKGPLRGVDVATVLRLDTSTLSRDLERMIARGWVVASPGTGRARSLEASRAGRALLAASIPAWRKAQAAAKQLLTPAVSSGLAGVVDVLWSQKDKS